MPYFKKLCFKYIHFVLGGVMLALKPAKCRQNIKKCIEKWTLFSFFEL